MTAPNKAGTSRPLVEFEPRITGDPAGEHDRDAWFSMLCPHCGERVIEVEIKVMEPPKHPLDTWGWNGELDPAKVTLWPSLLLKGHWHGFVTDGRMIYADNEGVR